MTRVLIVVLAGCVAQSPAPAPTCTHELEQAERCVAMLERSERVNRQCLAVLGARRELLSELDAGTY